MIASELINQMIPPLKITDDAHKAIVWMEEFRCNQLPVVHEQKFMGLISEDMILEANDIERLIGEYKLDAEECKVKNTAHFYSILKIASDHKAQSVAVVNEEDKYTGVISIPDLVTIFAQSAAIQMAGGILVLSMNLRDYSLTEISRLVEENNAKIISSTVKTDPVDNGMIKLTLKINTTDLTRIIATLERFDYKIIARFQDSEVSNLDQDKLDLLFRYLEI